MLIKESNIPYWKKIHDLLAKNRDDKINEVNMIDSLEKQREEIKKKKFQLLQKYREEMWLQLDEKNCVICYEGIARLHIFKARELVKLAVDIIFTLGLQQLLFMLLLMVMLLVTFDVVQHRFAVVVEIQLVLISKNQCYEFGELSKLTVQATNEKIADGYDINYYNPEKDNKFMFNVLEKILLDRNKLGIFDVEIIDKEPALIQRQIMLSENVHYLCFENLVESIEKDKSFQDKEDLLCEKYNQFVEKQNK
ncbi:hypothetical protein RFI_28966 [Reticulomyxa filosa]|uniref:Uncharacterized protein n=1 Tax=Reticulomyxa filosa TaxID=46433 RepID=X6M5X3_RETFI|nr:hypothetical protein RFI_28966 [Reticulomyxa filosa]|eukprot:ETO08420.1 hypothetical protein RFI_28966 [Reticulomyxa filosa]